MKSSVHSLASRNPVKLPRAQLRTAKQRRGESPPTDRQFIRGERKWLLPFLCGSLAFLSCALYARTAWYPFVNFDDGEYVFENPHLNTGLSWASVRWAMSSTLAGNWHPITWLSHALDVQLFGLNAGGHHALNASFHALNVVLLFLTLDRITRFRWRSLAVAALFAVHPLNVESVAWVAERKTLLCMLFGLLATAAYAWYVRRPAIGRYLWVVAYFALGLASQPKIIAFPFMLLLLDWWPLKRTPARGSSESSCGIEVSFFRLLLEKVPLLALSLASGIITIVAQKRAGAIAQITGWPFTWRLENAIHSYAMYVINTFVPVGLAPFYPGALLRLWQVAWAALLLIGITCLAWIYRSTRPYFLFGWLWFVGTLVPMIGIIQVGAQARADRYMYIPMIGILVAVIWGVSDALESAKWNPNWKYVAASVAVAVLLLTTWYQVGYWKSSYDLWSHTLAVNTGNAVAHENLAVSLLDQGREEEAFPHFQRVLLLRPDDEIALLNTGNYLERQGQHQEAIERFQRVRDTSHNTERLTGAYRGLGVAYAQMGDRKNAYVNFSQAMRLNPNGQTEMYNLALLGIRDAIDKLTQSIAQRPTADSYLQLGQLLQEDLRPEEAVAAYQNALQLNPRLTEARQAIEALTQVAKKN
jgi:protein O-mannosyl-transferase